VEICQIWRNSLLISPANLVVFLLLSGSAGALENPGIGIVVPEPGEQTWAEQGVENQEPTYQLASPDTETPNIENVEVLTEAPAQPTSTLLEQINQYSDPFGQVTNVSQLRDVQPTDWAYEALRSLIERYGIPLGYQDGTFRGNRPLTRYEFAAGLDGAFAVIESLLRRNADLVTQEDLAVLEKLKDEFVLELALARGDVDALTARTAELELTQFSTTTKLDGEIIFGFAGIATGEDAAGDDIDHATSFGHRTRLNLKSSFTGRDLLLTRLQAQGLDSLESRTLSPEGELAFTGATQSGLEIDALLYSFPIGSRTQIVVAANAGSADDFTDTLNPYLDGDGGSGAISRFATRAPIYYLVEGAGIGVRQTLSDQWEVSLGYLAGDAGDPTPGAGLFDGSYGALAQVVFQPSAQTGIGLTYVHAYNSYWQTGSNSANLGELPAVSNSLGIEAFYQVNPGLVLGGWAGYTDARVINQGDASIWNWAVTLAFPDLGKTGNLAGFVVGMEPKVTGSDDRLQSLGIEDASTSLHIEAFYQYQLTDNIAITPGVIWLTAPDHNSNNSDLLIGTVRTKFSF